MIDPRQVDRERLAGQIERAMLEKGIAQADLAHNLDVTQQAVSSWLTQSATPRRKVLEKLLDLLQIQWEDIRQHPGRRQPDSHLSPVHTSRTATATNGGKAERSVERSVGPDPATTHPPGDAPIGDGGPPSPDELAPGRGSSRAPHAYGDPRSPVEHAVLIPRNGHVAAGAGYVNQEEDDEVLYDPYPRHELMRLTQSNPDRLRSAVVVGDSMEPELRANDTVIYMPVEEVTDYGLYIFDIDDRTMVKLLQPRLGGVIDIIPANSHYTVERLIPLKDADTQNQYRSEQTGLTGIFRVRGKVVFYPKPA